MRDFDLYERKAFTLAAQRAGQFLDTIGKTDFACLTLEEYETMKRRMEQMEKEIDFLKGALKEARSEK